MSSKPSKIFVAYRALGIVCNHVPLSMRYINKTNENLVVTAVGKSFHTYSCSRLNLLSVSGQHPGDVTFLASNAYLVFSACGDTIYAWRRGTELKHTYKGPSEDVKFLYPLDTRLFAVYENNTLLIWDTKTEEVTKEVAFTNVSITTLIHPSTYPDKILIGTHEGCLLLWNYKSDKLIHKFKGWKSPVTVLEQPPALHMMAIGLENGDIYIHNISTDVTRMKFSQDWGPVTGISFRTYPISEAKKSRSKDNDTKADIMATSSTMGHIALWDLNKRRLHSEIRDAHKGCIASLEFLPNEPLLITSSSDNSIKMWIFDLPDQGGRLLRLREGHSCPPTKIRFYGSNGKNIISAGLDSTLRSFSTEADNLNKCLGQASYNRKAAKRKGVKNDPNKMFPVVDFVSDATREKDWDNVAAVHRNSRIVTTWSYDRSCMGEHMLIHDRFKGLKNIEALCLNISTCGNFVFIGYNSGHIDKFNIQSGIYRGSFGKEKAHEGCIRGIASDNFNQIVVSGASDKYLKFWKFKDHTLINEVELEENISKMMLHRESGMLAVALDDFSLVVVDIESKRVVRRFTENEGSVSDMTFSPDSRWLTVATMDSSIKTWDLPRGRLIDWFTVSPICVSLAMSSTGEYLATAHAGNLGIYLWANSTLYTNVTLYPLPDLYDPLEIDLPMITLDGRNESDVEEEEDDSEMVPEFKSPEQISDELVTLSLLPQSQWLNLLDLDIIKLRNKPKERVQIPKNAPFFLPVVSGLQPTFLIEEEKDWKKDGEKSSFFKAMQNASTFFRLLATCEENNDYKMVIEELKKLSPSKIDVEIRCLSPENGGSLEIMECFLKAMLDSLRTKKNFELVQSYLALFLQIHYDTVAGSEKLKSILEEIHKNRSWESLQEKINFCLCLGNYARSSVI